MRMIQDCTNIFFLLRICTILQPQQICYITRSIKISNYVYYTYIFFMLFNPVPLLTIAVRWEKKDYPTLSILMLIYATYCSRIFITTQLANRILLEVNLKLFLLCVLIILEIEDKKKSILIEYKNSYQQNLRIAR